MTIHLATHGILNATDGLQSYIHLSQDTEQDGRLYLEEIYGEKWPYTMVFLSACETGLGQVKVKKLKA